MGKREKRDAWLEVSGLLRENSLDAGKEPAAQLYGVSEFLRSPQPQNRTQYNKLGEPRSTTQQQAAYEKRVDGSVSSAQEPRCETMGPCTMYDGQLVPATRLRHRRPRV